VAAEAYEQLKLCRSADPEGEAGDWNAIRRRLDEHDARFHFHRAYRRACAPGRQRSEVEGPLVRALSLNPGLVREAAPPIGVLCLPAEDGELDTFEAIREQILEQVAGLVSQPPLGADPAAKPGFWEDVVGEAIGRLKRILDVLPPSEEGERQVWKMTWRLWQM